MGFDKWFEYGRIGTVLGQRVPEWGGSDGKGSIAPGAMLGPEWQRQEVTGGSVVVEQVSEVRGFVSEAKDFELDSLWRTEVMRSREWVRVNRRSAEFWMYCSLFRTSVDVPYATVNSGCDEGVNECFGSRERLWWTETGSIFQVEKGTSDVMFKEGVAVENDSKVGEV